MSSMMDTSPDVPLLKLGTPERFVMRTLKTLHPRPADRTKTLYYSAITVRHNDSLPQAYTRLIENSITFAPVMRGQDCVGVFQLLDVIKFVLDRWDEEPDLSVFNKFMHDTETASWRECKVEDVMKSYPIYKVNREFTRFFAMEALAHTDLPGLVVTDVAGNVWGVITTSMIISQLNRSILNDEMESNTRNMKVAKLFPSGFPEAKSVTEDSFAKDAFMTFAAGDRYGIAVTDKAGHLKDALTLKDLKGIRFNHSMMHRLWWTVQNFKSKVKSEAPLRQKLPSRGAALYVTGQDTLETLISLMADNHVHQIFVVKSKKDLTLQGVITHRDIIRAFIAK